MLSGLTPVLAEASRTILNNSGDMSCVGNEPLLTLERSACPPPFDAVLLGAPVPAAPELSRRLLDKHPHLKIVCIAPDGRDAVLHERRLDRTRIENVSFERILAALRDACASELAG